VLGIEAARLHLDLVDRRDAQARERRVVSLIPKGQAVHHEAELIGAAPTHLQSEDARLQTYGTRNTRDGQPLDLLTGYVGQASGDIRLNHGALCNNDNFLSLEHLFPHGDVDGCRLIDVDDDILDHLRGVSDIRGPNGMRPGGYVENDVVAIYIGNGPLGGSLDEDVHTDQGFAAFRVCDGPSNLSRLGKRHRPQEERKPEDADRFLVESHDRGRNWMTPSPGPAWIVVRARSRRRRALHRAHRWKSARLMSTDQGESGGSFVLTGGWSSHCRATNRRDSK